MKIDDLAEPRVREAFAGVVKKDRARLEAAFREMDETGSVGEAVTLATAIVGFVVLEEFGGKPSAGQVTQVAEGVASAESWLNPDAASIEKFVTATLNGQPVTDVLPAEDAVVLPFVVGASLVAARSEAVDGKWWFNQLDRIEAALEKV